MANENEKNQESLTLNSLPIELLCHIFEDIRVEHHPHSRVDACFKLAQVCRGWGEVVFNKSQLWTDVAISLDCPNEKRALEVITGRVERFNDAIQRSNPLPLAAYVLSNSHYWPNSTEILIPIIQAIKNCIFRIHTLEIALPSSILGHFTGVSAPLLHNLAIDAIDEVDMGRMEAKVEDLRNLTSTVQKMRTRMLNMRQIRMHWKHIVELEAVSLCGSDLLDILRQTPSIRKLKVLRVDSADKLPETDDYIQLDQLEELQLTFDQKDDMHVHRRNLFNKLTLPRLKSLTFDGCQLIHPSSLIHFFRRSRCSLEFLDLCSLGRLRHLPWIIQLLPDLKILNLEITGDVALADIFMAVLKPEVDGVKSRIPSALSKFSYKGRLMHKNPGWSILKECICDTPSLQYLDLTVHAYLRDVTVDDIWMDDESIDAIRELRAEGRHIKIEVWAGGNHFKDFVEDSSSRPALLYT